MRGTGNADDPGAAGQRGGHGLRPVDGDCGVLFAMNHYGGAGDLAEARGDIVAAGETSARFGEEFLGALTPFCDPTGVLNRLVDDDFGDALGKLVDWADREPLIEYACLLGGPRCTARDCAPGRGGCQRLSLGSRGSDASATGRQWLS